MDDEKFKDVNIEDLKGFRRQLGASVCTVVLVIDANGVWADTLKSYRTLSDYLKATDSEEFDDGDAGDDVLDKPHKDDRYVKNYMG